MVAGAITLTVLGCICQWVEWVEDKAGNMCVYKSLRAVEIQNRKYSPSFPIGADTFKWGTIIRKGTPLVV